MSCSRSYLFERTEFFFKRLEVYTEARPTVAMTDIITKVMVEVLTIIGIATEEISRGMWHLAVQYRYRPKKVPEEIGRKDWYQGCIDEVGQIDTAFLYALGYRTLCSTSQLHLMGLP